MEKVRRRRMAPLVLLLVAALVGGDPGTSGAAGRPVGRFVPPTGVLLGAWVDPDGRFISVERTKSNVRAFESMIGNKLAFDHHYYGWKQTFPSELDHWDIANRRMPLITWEPFDVDLDRIVDGTHDSLIRMRARAVRNAHYPVFLRWGHEPNGTWYEWGGPANNDPGQTNGPAKYVAAYRHIHDLFLAEGARNAVWVWTPNHESVPNAWWNHWTNYYPGDDYVDWVGIDGYNWGTTRSYGGWRSFMSIVRPVYDTYAARKPIMIVETGSVEQGGSKAVWLYWMARNVRDQMPSIAALVYTHMPDQWLVNSSASALAQFRTMARAPYWNPV